MVGRESRVQSNREAVEIIGSSRIFWVDVCRADEVVPGLDGKTLYHAGPPVDPATMCSAMCNAVYGAIVYEGWAGNLEEAAMVARTGEIRFGSAHDHSALGPMAGIISPTMPVMVMENKTFGNRSYVTINEGLGRTLRFGANDASVIDRLRWIEKVLGPLLKEALQLSGPVAITTIMARAVQRGDECHNRNKAATSLLIRAIAPWMVRTSYDKEDIAEALAFMDSNDHFFLNVSMAATKATMDVAHGIEGGSLVSCMASNGVEFGIKICGCGAKWYTAPAECAEGNYFEGYGLDDANPVMGDSYISETAGLGGVAMGLAPGIVQFIGGTVQEAITGTREMYSITAAEHPLYKIPSMDFRGTPLGIDVLLVLERGILPIINTGIAHKDPGVGQIGAGRFRPPRRCFELAASDFSYITQTKNRGG
jgi:hypothetical protein